jgi:hypothetical protein
MHESLWSDSELIVPMKRSDAGIFKQSIRPVTWYRNNRSPFPSQNVMYLVPVRVLAAPTGHWEFCSRGWADRQVGVEAGENNEDTWWLLFKLHAAYYTWQFHYLLQLLGNKWRTQCFRLFLHTPTSTVRRGAVDWYTALYDGRSRVRFTMVSFEVFLT